MEESTSPRNYVGSTWRSRFLRAPKIALELSSRGDLVPLRELATAKLGLKTGCDSFFFVDLDNQKTDQPKPPVGTLLVKGFQGWEGVLNKKDLLTAILNPHRLDRENGRRRFLIPKNTGSYYLRPADTPPKNDLKGYVHVAETANIHKRKLVSDNGSSKRWYRQVREPITSRWVLPYNSAYDYGAWDNNSGAVLNGRFVGIEPNETLDSDLIGAVLNSTIVLLMRLLEGVPTGVEGAFDVGPPAARLIKVPDVRLFDDKHAQLVLDAFQAIKKADYMPPAPSKDGVVDPLRNTLDLAILQAMGMSKGEASALASRMYESYARWRKAVEHVEMRMREYRSAMNRQGQNRRVHPHDLIARQLWDETSTLVKPYPIACLTEADGVELVDIPRQTKFPTQEALFEPGFLSTPDGKEINLGSYARVKYAALLISLGFEPPLAIPEDPKKAEQIIEAFQRDEQQWEKEVRLRAKAYVGDPKNTDKIVERTRRHWTRVCRVGGMSFLSNDGIAELEEDEESS
jgi:hypothetical protein